jgi:hypothetical protein
VDDRNHLLMRAEEEEAKAAEAADEPARRAHLELAAVYRTTALSLCPRWLPVGRNTDPLTPDPPEPPLPQQP